jgi:hypothetical protein
MAWTSALVALLAATTVANPTRRAAPVSSTTCNGKTYVYESLAGYGFTPSDARDKFGDTAGGIGSSAAIDPNSWKKSGNTYTGTLWALPDRGWNTEGTLNFQPRVHKFGITFTPNPSASASKPAKPNLQLTYQDTIRFTDPAGNPLTGLDPDFTEPYLSFPGIGQVPSATYEGDGFGGDGPGGTRVSGDTEGLVLSKDGSFWISDEYGAYIYRFDPSGKMIGAIAPPPAVIPRRNDSISFSAASPPRYDPDLEVDPEDPDSGRNNNQGLEGLTASPDGKYLYALLQSAAIQEGGMDDGTRRYVRFFKYDVSNAARPVYVAEYVVPLPQYDDGDNVAAQSEVKFISDTQFIVLARDGGAGAGQDDTESVYRHADVFDISAATNIKGDTYDCETCSIASEDGVLKEGIVPATYCPWLDYNVNSELNKFGVHNGGEQDAGLLNEKWESLCLVPVEPDSGRSWGDWGSPKSDEYFLFSLSDNDFITQNGFMKGGELPYADESGFSLLNQVLVFKVKLPKGSKPRIG